MVRQMNLMSLTAVELGRKIQAGEVTVKEAVTAALDAIEAREGKVSLRRKPERILWEWRMTALSVWVLPKPAARSLRL